MDETNPFIGANERVFMAFANDPSAIYVCVNCGAGYTEMVTFRDCIDCGGTLVDRSGNGVPSSQIVTTPDTELGFDGQGAKSAGQRTTIPETICVVVPGTGGIIGEFRSQTRRISESLRKYNDDGYRMVQFSPEHEPNLLRRLLQVFCLIITLFLWCPGSNGLLFLERDVDIQHE